MAFEYIIKQYENRIAFSIRHSQIPNNVGMAIIFLHRHACIVLYYEFKKKLFLLTISIFEFNFKHTKQIMQVEGKSH